MRPLFLHAILIIAVIFGAIGCAAPPTTTPTPTPNSTLSFKEYQYFFMMIPQGWSTTEGEYQLQFKSPDKEADIIVDITTPTDRTIADYTLIYRQGLRTTYEKTGAKNFTILFDSDRYVAETSAHEFVYTWEMPRYLSKCKHIILVSDKPISNKRAMSFALLTSPETFSTYESIFEEMLKSIRLK